MGQQIDFEKQPKIRARPMIDCPTCQLKMIVYTVELPDGTMDDRTIHKCGVPKDYLRPAWLQEERVFDSLQADK